MTIEERAHRRGYIKEWLRMWDYMLRCQLSLIAVAKGWPPPEEGNQP